MKTLLAGMKAFLTKSPTAYAEYVQDKITIEVEAQMTVFEWEAILEHEARLLKRGDKEFRRSR